MRDKILIVCAIVCAVCVAVWCACDLCERLYYRGVEQGWQGCIEENNLYYRYGD